MNILMVLKTKVSMVLATIKKRQSKALCCDVNLMYYAGNARSLPENGTRKAVADRHIFVRLWFRPSPRLRPICHKKATYSYF